jgi:hypothetical protein
MRETFEERDDADDRRSELRLRILGPLAYFLVVAGPVGLIMLQYFGKFK